MEVNAEVLVISHGRKENPMPVDPRKRQKKKEKQAAKRKEKHQQLTRVKTAGLAERLTSASRYPVVDSWVGDGLLQHGIGQVGVARELPNGSVAFAMFLVDRHCLGVKNALAEVEGRFSYESRMRDLRSKFGTRDISPATARGFVESAVSYAASLGIAPHADYYKAKLIFGDINPADAQEELEFGQDGKPFFVAGPYDTPQRCRQIQAALERHCGPGGYHFIMPLSEHLPLEALEPDMAQLPGPADAEEAFPDAE
jgi:hypothetical protein